MEDLSDQYLMRLHLFYNRHKHDPLAAKHLCGIDIHMRTSVKHLWNIEKLQRDNNITPTI